MIFFFLPDETIREATRIVKIACIFLYFFFSGNFLSEKLKSNYNDNY